MLADQLILTIGGCAANVAVDLVKLGVAAGVVGCVGDDVFGRVVAEMLRERRVDVSGLLSRPGLDTSQTLIVNVQGQDRRFIHTFGANAAFTARDIPLDAPGCKVLYLGGYFLMEHVRPRELAEVFAQAPRERPADGPRRGDARSGALPAAPGGSAARGGRVPAQRPRGSSDHRIERSAGAGGDVPPHGRPDSDHHPGRSRLGAGRRGAALRADTFPMPFIDGTGGGDAFAAGYIAGLLQGREPIECLRLASAVGASCVRAIGTTTGVFTAEECEAFLQQNTLKIERI